MTERIEPAFDVQVWNDPAISPGVRVENVITMQYDGYLVGAKITGAGIEGCYLHFSDGQEQQMLPGRDVAVDSDLLAMSPTGPLPGTLPNGFQAINAPLAKGTKISITEQGTGTAEGNLYVIFSKSPAGPYTLNKSVLVDYSAAAFGDTIMDNPTFMRSLKRIFVRGAAGQDLTVQLGAGGQTVVVPVRAIAVNTDLNPHGYHPIDSVTPDKLLFTAMNGFSGTAWTYVQFE